MAEIKKDLNKNKENRNVPKKWMKEMEKRLAQLEKKLVTKRIGVLKQKYKNTVK